MLDRLSRSLRKHGVLRTARFGLRLLKQRWVTRWRRVSGAWYDAVHRSRTTGIVHPYDGAPFWYEGSPTGLFRKLVRSLPIAHERFAFVDLGCGKGRALLLAAEFPFRRIVGVDSWPEMAEAARRNVASFRPSSRVAAASIEVVDGDATSFDLPPDPLVVFLYNPFPAPVMAAVLENLSRSLRERPREAFVVYVNPIERGLLDAAPFLEPTASGKDFAIYRAAEEAAGRRAIRAA